MKNICKILFLLSYAILYSQPGSAVVIPCNPIIIPLRTYTEIPKDQCYYMKDTNDELNDYEGTWSATWNNKTFHITFKKITNQYDSHFKYNKDLLIAKFKVVNSNGGIVFDNTTISDNNAKIKGGKFTKDKNEYSFSYFDNELCRTRGYITIKLTDQTKTQMQWKYSPSRVTIFPDCFFYNYAVSQYPDPIPKNIILSKQ